MQNLKILFSPSENKTLHGSGDSFNPNSLLFSDGDSLRADLTKKYNSIMTSSDEDEVHRLTGLKKYDDAKEFCKDIYEMPLAVAIERYVGVAFDYLSYSTMNLDEQKFIKENTIIFSNLFGAISAGDMIPPYKLKQGEKLDNLNIASLYKKHFSSYLDTFLENSLIIDLRAGYYEKFYSPKSQVVSMKFLKNGKTVSHWAKAWRGLILRSIAKNRPNSLEDILKMKTAGIELVEEKSTVSKIELIYKIEDA